ncbi:MAG: polysaccharide deacetylase family protein, partial [Thiotrichaceae bacterium]
MIFTTNVVDWQQSALDSNHPVSNHVWRHTVAMLEILRANDISGTFFIQHKVASKYPVLVRKIQTAGHEVGCLIDTPYDKQSFQQIAQNAIQSLEDIAGVKVIGTRCNGISVHNTSFDHYCNVLRNQGIQYDSSIITNKNINQHLENNPALGAFKAYGISQYTLPCFFAPPLLSRLKLTFGDSTLRLLPYEFTYILANRLDRD